MKMMMLRNTFRISIFKRFISQKLDPFRPVDSDLVPFIEDLNPPVKRSYNLAAYVNKSHTLQELLKLGVSLFDIESTNYEAAKGLLLLDFERDCVEHIKFLVDNGLKRGNLGRFISEFPKLFDEHLDDFQTRLNYYEAKGFNRRQITVGLNASSHFISHKTKSIDYKLGAIQVEFNMPAAELRTLVSSHPLVIALHENQFEIINTVLYNEFGFTVKEIHKMLVKQPQILEFVKSVIIERLELVHNQIGLSHRTIAEFPKLITGPRVEITNRAMYLKTLKRDQYNPRLPLYVPPKALYHSNDEEFCRKYAKTSIDDFKLFIKSH